MKNEVFDSIAKQHLDDCLNNLGQKIVSLEARFTGPLLHTTNSQNSLQQSRSSDHTEQTKISQYFPSKVGKSTRKRSTKDSNSIINVNMSDPFKAYFSPERQKRPRAGDVEELSDQGQSAYKKFKTSEPVFSRAFSDSQQSNNPREDQPKSPEALDIFTDFMNNPQTGNLLKSAMFSTLNQKVQKLTKDLTQIEQALNEKDQMLVLKQSQIQGLNMELARKEEELAGVQEKVVKMQQSQVKGRNALIRTLRALEDKKRQEIKTRLSNDSFRLGRVTMNRSGTRFQEFWEDGKEILETKENLSQIAAQKEILQKQRKQIKKIQDPQLVATLPLKLALLQREESVLKQKLDKLEIEKNLYIQESRRVAQQDSAKYSKTTLEHQAWPVLHGRYLLLSLLGKGGYSQVYKAYCLLDNIYLAIKFHQLNPSWPQAVKANYIKHALRENSIHRQLNHPRIVKHFDTLQIDNNCFCTILEYCSGEDLHMYLKRHKFLSEKEAKNIIFQIFCGLKYLSQQPETIIHYDLKPHNILLNKGEVKITDFGLSKIMDPSKTNMELTSQGVGTYWYQAPECFETGTKARICSKVDVWSAGVILYEILYGQRPFGHNMPQERVLKEQVIVNATAVNFPSKPNVSQDCREFIKKCLEYSQDNRWDVFEAFNSNFLTGKK